MKKCVIWQKRKLDNTVSGTTVKRKGELHLCPVWQRAVKNSRKFSQIHHPVISVSSSQILGAVGVQDRMSRPSPQGPDPADNAGVPGGNFVYLRRPLRTGSWVWIPLVQGFGEAHRTRSIVAMLHHLWDKSVQRCRYFCFLWTLMFPIQDTWSSALARSSWGEDICRWCEDGSKYMCALIDSIVLWSGFSLICFLLLLHSSAPAISVWV